MNWAPGFSEVISGLKDVGGYIVEEFQSLQAAWVSWAGAEHNEDGTHGAITADTVTARSIQPDPDLATTSALGAAYDATNNRRTGPWQAIYGWAVTAYDTLTLGTNSAAQVGVDVTSRSGEGVLLRSTKGIAPFTDNVSDLGVALNPPGVSNAGNHRWRHVALADTLFIGSANLRIRTGTGTPEGALTGRVGDLYLRSDGGASTTFYVKESGTGNTGWVGK